MPTTYNKSTLSTFFQNGDVPQGSDYQNLIYSQVNLVETAIQTMAGPLFTTDLTTANVSASNLNIINSVTFPGAFSVSAGGATLGNNLSVNNNLDVGNSVTISNGLDVGSSATVGGNLTVDNALDVEGFSTFNFNAKVSGNLNVVFNVSAATLYTNTITKPVAIVSATGTAQATAALISTSIGIVRLQGVTDGQATGFLLPSARNNLGIEQTLCYEGAVSANLWPNSGCNINALSSNVPFPLVANTNYLVIYKAVSSYGVK